MESDVGMFLCYRRPSTLEEKPGILLGDDFGSCTGGNRLLRLLLLLLLQVHFRDHFIDNFATSFLPFLSVANGVIQVFVTAHAKHTTVLEFLGLWNNVKVEKADFPFVPTVGGVLLGSTLQKGSGSLLEEALVPLAVNVPVLHSVRNIRRLNQVLNHNRGLAVHRVVIFGRRRR